MRLITIAISHYVEKAKWALERSGLSYEEECHIPGIHAAATLWATKGASRTTPVLIDGNDVIGDSTAILKHLAAKYNQTWIYPAHIANDVMRFEESFDENIGPHVRRNIYFNLFESGYDVGKVFDQVAPAWQRRLLPVYAPVMKMMMATSMRINKKDALRSRDIFEREFDRVEKMLLDGRKYLTGDTFTAADLTFAALSAAAVLPQGYGAALPDLNDSDFSDDLRKQVTGYRERPAGKFVLRLYQEERR